MRLVWRHPYFRAEWTGLSNAPNAVCDREYIKKHFEFLLMNFFYLFLLMGGGGRLYTDGGEGGGKREKERQGVGRERGKGQTVRQGKGKRDKSVCV